jgi:hypothetical protein
VDQQADHQQKDQDQRNQNDVGQQADHQQKDQDQRSQNDVDQQADHQPKVQEIEDQDQKNQDLVDLQADHQPKAQDIEDQDHKNQDNEDQVHLEGQNQKIAEIIQRNQIIKVLNLDLGLMDNQDIMDQEEIIDQEVLKVNLKIKHHIMKEHSQVVQIGLILERNIKKDLIPNRKD